MEVELKPSEQLSSEHDLLIDEVQLKLQLEGQCKIITTRLLEFSYIKTVLLTLPIIISIIGLFLIKYSKNLRAKIFYWESDRSVATHLYVKGRDDGEEEIVELKRQGEQIFFFYKNLKYEFLLNNIHVPVAINYQKQLQKRIGTTFVASGLTNQEALQRKALYGSNQHIVQPPLYFQYMYEIMTEPFFFVQYLASFIYIVEKLTEMAILLLGASVVTTSINYILLYISYRKIKEIAEVVVEVQVLRSGVFVSLPSTELVPGDIFIPKNELYCDVILINGELYVNQSNLTGESIPIGKFPLQSFSQYKKDDTSKWIYEGSKILSTHNALAIALHTGYTSKRGRILRKILHRNPATPHFFTTCMYFLLFNLAIGMVVYLGTLPVSISNQNIASIIIFLNCLLIIPFCLPPSSPIYFNLVYSFSLLRLKFRDILGTQPEKTVEAAHLKTMCFDKTGTLTEDKVQVHKVFKFFSETFMDITNRPTDQRDLDEKVFGCCHTVKFFEEQLMGDQIDLKMFMYSKYELSEKCESNSCFQIVSKVGDPYARLKILKIYQYQSKFQSMSVMVHDTETDKYYIFVKGAPEIIHKNSTITYSYFDDLLQNVSYGGFRTIAYGYKEVKIQQIEAWLNESRQNFMKNIKILGLLVFQNNLKKDSAETISLLSQAGIQSKMITGDNIYIAIETAIRCGILARNEEIIVIEGKNQKFESNNILENQVIQIKRFTFKDEKAVIVKDRLEYQQYLRQRQSIIIDNDFLVLQKKYPEFELAEKIKVYARISPQNKALIVKLLKKGVQKRRKNMKRISRLLAVEVDKIGMVGDGANDLLAIKQADIGVGIRNCDSSYAANFSIMELSGLEYIVRESKCGQRSIIQIERFITCTAFLQITLLLIMESQACFFSSVQLFFGGITKYIVFPFLLALSRPAQKQTMHKPCSNFLKMQNQLVHWGNSIIGTLGILATMIYYRSTEEYVWNRTQITFDSGWVSQTSMVTSQFLFYNIFPIFLVFSMYQSNPWKEPIYKNYLLFIMILLNAAISIALSFLVPQLRNFFSLTEMSYKSMGFIFMIGIIAGILMLIYNSLISSLKLHENRQREEIPQKQDLEVMQRLQTHSGSVNRS